MIRNNVRTVRPQDGESQWRSLDQYNSTYWSGLDVRLFVNGIFVDELVHIQWEVQEAVRPLYNYSSYVYDRVIRGARRVSGAFSLNYKRDAYIFELLQAVDSKTEEKASSLRLDTTKAEYEANSIAKSGVGTVEDLLSLIESDTITVRRSGDRRKLNMSGVARIAAQFEDAILGTPIKVPAGAGPTASALISKASTASPLLDSSIPMKFIVRLGGYQSDLQYGNKLPSQLSPEVGKVPFVKVGTGHVLYDVQILSRAITIDDSGRPLHETFSFLARDVV